jgi:hypothetical protein
MSGVMRLRHGSSAASRRRGAMAARRAWAAGLEGYKLAFGNRRGARRWPGGPARALDEYKPLTIMEGREH